MIRANIALYPKLHLWISNRYPNLFSFHNIFSSRAFPYIWYCGANMRMRQFIKESFLVTPPTCSLPSRRHPYLFRIHELHVFFLRTHRIWIIMLAPHQLLQRFFQPPSPIAVAAPIVVARVSVSSSILWIVSSDTPWRPLSPLAWRLARSKFR